MTLQTAAATLEQYARAQGSLEAVDNLQCLCASCAFLGFVECGGTDMDQFDWSAPAYLGVAYQILARHLRGRDSDWYDYNRRSSLRCRRITAAPGCGAWTRHFGLNVNAFDAKDVVDLLRTRLSPKDFAVLDALCLQGYSIRDYAPIWAASGSYRGRRTPQHSENALSKRFRAVLRTARQCLAGAV